ncbi:hypothetical protein PhCBS80983_g04887 [Powellomyces hirtus]|uniref:Threonine/serine exporter-like N-terminal domain-containing protein n=1 Tax=Powellomyces hirtus TaxID=109895 RepID=A0A507DWS8_9FUNG|nr:hypothetical protein PhCBS80983_g04887 [Powellomyces hirtus]
MVDRRREEMASATGQEFPLDDNATIGNGGGQLAKSSGLYPVTQARGCTSMDIPDRSSFAPSSAVDSTYNYDLLLELSEALLAYGTPSHRIEALVHTLGTALSVPVTVHYLPTFTILDFEATSVPAGRKSHHIIKTRGGWDFGKLQRLHKLVKNVIRSGAAVDPHEARIELKAIKATADDWSELWIVGAYPLSAATSAIMFFHGDGGDALASGLLAIIPALMRLLANRYPAFWWTYEIITCALVSVIASSISSTSCYSSLLLSSVVTLLPGYTVTAAVVEVLTKNVVAGAARLCYVAVHLAAMAYGLTLAPILYNAAMGNGFDRRPLNSEQACATEQNIAVSHYWLFLCVPVYIVSYNIYLKAPFRQWIVMSAVGALGYFAGYLCKRVWHSPPEVNAFVAALCIGVTANAYSRWKDDLGFNAITAGVFIQVPGSWGLRGMLALAYQEYDRALYWNYSMLAICVGISGALLMSNVIVFGPRLKNRGVPLTDF